MGISDEIEDSIISIDETAISLQLEIKAMIWKLQSHYNFYIILQGPTSNHNSEYALKQF